MYLPSRFLDRMMVFQHLPIFLINTILTFQDPRPTIYIFSFFFSLTQLSTDLFPTVMTPLGITLLALLLFLEEHASIC